MKIIYVFTMLLAFSINTYAQQRNVSGNVTSGEDQLPLSGVSVGVTGTTIGTITDSDGNYQLDVPESATTLYFSFIGMETQKVALTAQSVYNIIMQSVAFGFDEVVVTALGIEKKSRSLTYSTQKIEGDELTRVKDVNMINSLAGKTAGLVIGKSSSGLGGSSRVIIRGNKSISGENQPLYVIDGMPINNSSMGQIGGSQLSGSVDGGDAISNINPEDIESVNVLKGASASALYGSLGQNGVILITTKKGVAGKTIIELTSSTNFESTLLLPELQGAYGATTPVNTANTNNSPATWGTKDNGAITTSDLEKFYQTGITTINGASVRSGNEKSQYYMSYANTSGKGIVETNNLNKNNFYLKANSKVNDKLSFEGSANLITQTVKNRPYIGFNSNPVGEAILYPGSSSAFGELKNNYQVWDDIRKVYVQNYPYSSFNSGSYILDNPYWTIHKNTNELKRSRSIYNGGLKWDITDKLNFSTRTSYDRIDDNFEQNVYSTSSSIVYDINGAYTLQKNTTTQVYSDALLSYTNNEISDFSLNAVIGFSNNYTYGTSLLVQSKTGNNNLDIANVFSLSNLINDFTHTESSTETLMQSIFGTATVGWKNMLFVDATGRNEWASTIPDESYFYPSVGGTFILSELIAANRILSFAKLRVTYSEVGNALPYGVNNDANRLYYPTVNGGIVSPVNGLPKNEDGTYIYLKPERSKSTEIGANLRFLDNSIDLDITYYNNIIENQYFPVTAPLGAYVPNFLVNAGEIQNKGIELTLSYKSNPSKNLKYSTAFNFAYNKNEVISVNEEANLDSYTITQFANTKIADIRIVKGGEFGDIYATTFSRDANGKILTNATTGQPIASNQYVKVGNPNSPTSLGWSNTINYKDFIFNILIDGKFGGDVISLTESLLDANGRSIRTADARDAGQVIFEGETVATGDAEIASWYQGLSAIGSNYVYDATNIRIREILLGYNVPVAFAKGLLKNLNVSVYGRNLLFLYKNSPVDPEVSVASSTGLQGIDALSLPSTKSFGFSLKVTF